MRSPLRPLLALVVLVLGCTAVTVGAFLESLDTRHVEPPRAVMAEDGTPATTCCSGQRPEVLAPVAPASPMARKSGDAPAG